VTNKILLKDILSQPLPILEIMDIGAMIEGKDRYDILVDQGLARVTGFEPNLDNLEKLKARKGPYRYLPFFLGNGKKAKFHLTRYPGCSSLLEPNEDIIDLFTSIGTKPDIGNFSVIEITEVQTVRLDDINNAALPDYVKIDVQGAELLVMENARETFSNVLVLETEVEFIHIYKDQPLFGEIHNFMVECGFMLHKLVDIAGRSLRPFSPQNPYQAASQVLWADAIFVRDYTNLSKFSNDQILKASAILNDVYLSYDVVVRLLTEYDIRQETNLKDEYIKNLEARETLDRLYMNLKE
jgi:FkbM family methyltransferase